jgi:flagellar protein FliO/FliZ
MQFTDLLRMIFALAMTLGLLGLLVVGMRRYGPETLKRLQGSRADRRMAVLESLVLDPSRRLVLVRIDAEERLILLGEGQILPARTPVTEGRGRDQTDA